MSTVFVFSFLTLIGIGCINDGLTRVYFNVDDFGWPYLVGSVLIYILVHDTKTIFPNMATGRCILKWR